MLMVAKISKKNPQGTCQKLAEGRGVEKEGGSQLFETAEKGGVMKNGPLKGEGHANMCP